MAEIDRDSEELIKPKDASDNKSEERTSPFPLFATLPENVVFHWVQPHELERIMHIERPFSLAIAAATTGFALGLFPLVHDAFNAINDLSKVSSQDMFWHITWAMTFTLSIGIAIITWIDALRGKSDARQLLEEIKKRPKVPLSEIVRR